MWKKTAGAVSVTVCIMIRIVSGVVNREVELCHVGRAHVQTKAVLRVLCLSAGGLMCLSLSAPADLVPKDRAIAANFSVLQDRHRSTRPYNSCRADRYVHAVRANIRFTCYNSCYCGPLRLALYVP